MKLIRLTAHMLFTLVLTFLILVLPAAIKFNLFGENGNSSTDVTSSASLKLPDEPSGEFLVLINESLHKETLGDWKIFFSGEDLPVIFEDISCITADADTPGTQLAQRFQAQLPENQMKLRQENLTMLISKAESGNIDIAVFSVELADAMKLSYEKGIDGITVIRVKGGDGSDEKA